MKRTHAWFVVEIAVIVLLVAGTAAGQVWHASSGFSQSQNPNGQWSYGWTQTLGGTFNLMTGQTTFCTTPAWNAPAVSNYLVVQHNVLPIPKSCGSGTYQPLGLVIHPGPSNERSVVRWTAPASGACSI